MYRLGREGKQNVKIVKVMDIFCFSEHEHAYRIDRFVSDLVFL